MPSEQRGLIAHSASASRITDKRRERVHGGGDVVKGARPAAAALTGAPELRHAHRESGGRERRREWAGVGPVKGHTPEPAMQEDHQRCRARTSGQCPPR
jgi:hypothetical protein